MSRKPRIHTPGAIYHVIHRGNAGQDIFSDDKDRYRMYDIILKSTERFQYRVLAFCLMTSHIHMAIQVGEKPLSRIMQSLSQRYTQWFNWRYRRSGHLFQGRYKAVMVDADAYLLELAAYIHLNPVRAHMVDRPENHRWSSHRAYLGKENLNWLDSATILSQFSPRVGKARTMFEEFVGERIVDERRREFHGERNIDSRILGDDNFVGTVLAQCESAPERKPDLTEVVEAVKRLYGRTDDFMRNRGQERVAAEARGLAAWATREFSDGKLADLARQVGRDPSTLTCAVRRLARRREKDSQLADKMERLRSELLDDHA